jgi:hypothetical protein
MKIRVSIRFANDGHLKVMLAGFDVAGIDPLHAALLEGFEFLVRINVMGHRPAPQMDFGYSSFSSN